jgi:transposase
MPQAPPSRRAAVPHRHRHPAHQAERDLRPAKTQQKISGRLRSETTTRHRYAIRGYASTARKHNIDVFTAIKDALAGNPWIPPIPAMA